jgi:hypothetical protein
MRVVAAGAKFTWRSTMFVGVTTLFLAASSLTGPSSAAPVRGVRGSLVSESAQESSVSPDFNGDGFADLAVGGQWYPDSANLPEGLITVIYGAADGLTAKGDQQWSAADFSTGRDFEYFGGAMASGDFDGDRFTDLAIGVLPGSEEVAPFNGEVRIIYGSRSGLAAGRSQLWTANSPGIPGASRERDGFGSTLVAANFGRSVHDDLAIGAAERHGSRGAVTVLYGTAHGLTSTGSQLWTQGSAGVPGQPATNESFGDALASGNFTGRAYADLAIGVPGDGARNRADGWGGVNVLHGSANGLTARGAQLWSQKTSGIKGSARREEGFGFSLAAGHFAGKVTADLAIGVRSDTETGEYNGSVNVIYGSANGLTAEGDQLWTRQTAGLTGKRHLDQFLASTLAAGNFGLDYGGGAYDDLAVSAASDFSTEDVITSRGVVEVIYGSASGLSAENSQNWRWDSPGIKGREPGEGGAFGESLLAANFGQDVGRRTFADLAVGDSLFDAGGNHWGGVSAIYGSPRGLTATHSQLWTVSALPRTEPRFFATSLRSG